MKPFSYTNSCGDTYYIHTLRLGRSRTAYLMRRLPEGALSKLPEGYEVRENVHGQVSVRRKRHRSFTEIEECLLSSQLQRMRPSGYRLDITERAATVYASAMDRKCFEESLDAEFANGFADALNKTLAKRYSSELIALFRARQREKGHRRPRFYPLLRLAVADKHKRLFTVERVCFTGDQAWIRLETMPLSAAIFKYFPHLGKDSFFDLI